MQRILLIDDDYALTQFLTEYLCSENFTVQVANNGFDGLKLLRQSSFDLVLLDELTYMLSYHYLPLERIEQALLQRPAAQHVVITGRACHRRLIELADTVSEVQNIKHAFDHGIKAQRGIDW